MIETVEYTCKFCGQKRAFECDMPEKPEARWHVDKVKKLLCCNRCGDHEEKRRRLERAVCAAAQWLMRWRFELGQRIEVTYDDETVSELKQRLDTIEHKARTILITLTKRFTYCVCEFKHVTPVWSEDFVDQIKAKPYQAQNFLRYYREHIAK